MFKANSLFQINGGFHTYFHCYVSVMVQSSCAIRKLYGRHLYGSWFLNLRIINVAFIKINTVSLPAEISSHIKK